VHGDGGNGTYSVLFDIQRCFASAYGLTRDEFDNLFLAFEKEYVSYVVWYSCASEKGFTGDVVLYWCVSGKEFTRYINYY
jgi:hypothetical protein